MKYSLIFTDTYNKCAKKFLKCHPGLIELYQKSLELLSLNPHHSSLRLHRLEGKLKNLYSISIHLKYRITFEFILDNEKILLINIGNHRTAYGN